MNTAFPDKYIRSVVVQAALYFYIVDEEGTPTHSSSVVTLVETFVMQRDMLYNIPEEYQADSLQGTIVSPMMRTTIEVSNRMEMVGMAVTSSIKNTKD